MLRHNEVRCGVRQVVEREWTAKAPRTPNEMRLRFMPKEIEVTVLPGGSRQEVPKGTTVSEILGKAGRSADAWIAAKLNGQLVDLTRTVEENSALEGIGPDSPAAIEILRHSAAHIMAQAVKSIFPEARVGIGPAIENGFY